MENWVETWAKTRGLPLRFNFEPQPYGCVVFEATLITLV